MKPMVPAYRGVLQNGDECCGYPPSPETPLYKVLHDYECTVLPPRDLAIDTQLASEQKLIS